MTSRLACDPAVIYDTDGMRAETFIAESDCACPLSISPDHHANRLARLKSDRAAFFEHVLYRSPVTKMGGPALFTTLASAHSEAGIAVVNSEALHLWEQFEEPSSAETVLQRLGVDEMLPSYQEALARLYLNGFLSETPITQAPLAHEDTLIAWLHTTNACNLRCNYCYLTKTSEMMDEQVGMQAIDAIFRSAKANNFSKVKIKYAGGEATLSFSLVIRLHDYARHMADANSIALNGVVLSNGVRLTRELVCAMMERNLRLMISLDGLGADHDQQRHFANGSGSFLRVAENIDMAQEMGLTPNICVTVTGRSAAGLPKLIEWILERNLPFSINFYRENEESASFAELQLDEERIIQGMLATFKVIEANLPRRSLLASLVDRANLSAPHARPCATGHSYLVIDHFGRVAKCQMEINKPVTTISAADPLAIIRSDRAGIQNFSVDEKEGCRDCEWKYWCAGGCPQATYRATGRYDIKSPNCNIYKTLYPEAVRLEALRLLKYHNA